MKNYLCGNCGASFRLASKPNYCPACGADRVLRNDLKGRKYALEQAARLLELKPQLEKAFGEYAELYGEMEAIRITLRQYKRRGIITESEIPVIEKPNLAEKLREYREKRADG